MSLKKIKIIFISLIVAIIGLIFYLIYSILSDNITFILKGNVNDTVYLNETYADLGYIAILKNGDDISDNVNVKSYLDTSKIGTYKIKYILKHKFITKTLIRYVDVVKNPIMDINLSLNGDNVIYLLKNSNYVEKGIKAIDVIDGDISKSLIIDSNINDSVVGEYNVNYKVINSRNVEKSINRKVIVYDLIYDIEISKGSNGINFKFNAKSEIIKNIDINGKIENTENISLVLEDNKEYTIKINDIYGNYKELYYDFLKPIVACEAIVSENGTLVNAVATDNADIIRYFYTLDGVKYEGNTKYNNTNVFASNVQVEAVDNSGNIGIAKCSIDDIAPVFNSGLKEMQSDLYGFKYYLYVPENTKVYKKSPLLTFLHGSYERGSNLSDISIYGPVKYINDGGKFDFFFIAPQLPRSIWPTREEDLFGLIKEVCDKYNIDSNRLTLSGFSIGATGSMTIIKDNPGYFSSAILIAPGTKEYGFAKYFKGLPTWVFYGTNDTYSNNNYTKDFIVELGDKYNTEVKLTTYKGYGHNVVPFVFKETELIPWMLSKVKTS